MQAQALARNNCEEQRSRIIRALYGDDVENPTSLNAYFGFLGEQSQSARQTTLAPILALAGFGVDGPLHESLHVIADIAELVQADKSPHRHADSVLQGLFQLYGTTPAVRNEDNKPRWQAVMVVLCWLTLAIQPDVVCCKKAYDYLIKETGSSPKRAFNHILQRGGDILPKSSVTGPSQLWPSHVLESQLYVSSLNVWSLRTFGKVRILWTSSLAAHLRLDQETRTLHLFRFPTLCSLNLQAKTVTPLFKNVLNGDNSDAEAKECILDRYQQEVLLSYRVLFGQKKSSRKDYLSREKPQLAANNTLIDPLLTLLCSQPANRSIQALSSKLWLETCKGPSDQLLEQDVYDAGVDFRLLGDRMLELQKFNNRQRPSRMRDLWRDRRDPLQWYTFWAVLVVGGFSVLLSITQSALAAAQLHSQMHPPT